MKKVITFIFLFLVSASIALAVESQTPSAYLIYDDFNTGINTSVWNTAATMVWGASFGIGVNWSAGGVNSTDTNGQLINNNGSVTNHTYCIRMYDTLNKTPIATWEGIMISDTVSSWAMFVGQKTDTDRSYYVTWDGSGYTNTTVLRTLDYHDFCIWSGNGTGLGKPYAYIDGNLVDIGANPAGTPTVTEVLIGRYLARSTTSNRYDVFRVWQGNYSNMPTINASTLFTITATNAITGSDIANFTAVVNGTLYNSTVATAILTTNYTLGNATINITLSSRFFQNKTYTNVSMTTPLAATLTPEFSFNLTGYSNYTIYDNKNYTRTIIYNISYVCMPGYNNSLNLKDDNIIREEGIAITCNSSIFTLSRGYTALNESNHSIGFFIYSNYTANPMVNVNFGNRSFLWDLYAPNATGAINRTTAFNFSLTNVNLTCIDGVMRSLNYTLQFNNNTLYNRNNTNGTTQTNTTGIITGLNTYLGTCGDPWGNSTVYITDNAYSNTLYLINEKDNILFDVNNITIARVYIDDNSTLFDFKTANTSAINVTVWGTAKLRFEFGAYDGAFPEVMRYIDTSLVNGSIRVCANKDDAVHYELILYATTEKEVIQKSVFSNCLVGADYTRFAYQNSLVLKTYTINTLYYLYTFDDDNQQIYLSAIDGSIAQEIDIDTLEFNLQSYNIGTSGDAITTYKNESLPTSAKIEYINYDDNNANITISITRLDTDTEIFRSSTFTDPNAVVIYYDWNTLIGVTNTTIFQIIIDKTLTNGKSQQIKAYFDTMANQAKLNSAFALIVAVLLVLFGLTLLSTKTTLSWFGILIIIAGLAVMSMSPVTWYIKFFMGVLIIGAMYLMAIMIGENRTMVS